MQDGLYLAQFIVGGMTTYGVSLKRGEEIIGGNDSHWWVGSLDFPSDDTFATTLAVQSMRPSERSAFGFFDTLEITFNGSHKTDAWQSTGNTMMGVAAQMNLRLLRGD